MISSYLRRHGFVLGLALAILLAFLFPGPGSREGLLRPELVSTAGIALILFLQGLSLAWEKVRAGAGQWRIHLLIQSFTFLVFPLVGFLLFLFLPAFWRTEPPGIRDGLLYLCVLPSTISTSVVLTSMAHGNTTAALFNAAVSNLLGVVLTPLFVHLLMQTAHHPAPFGPLLLKITLLTLLPFSLGLILRRFVAATVDREKRWVARLSNGIILFIVYTAFCDSVESRIWVQYGAGLTVAVFLLIGVLFGFMSLLVGLGCAAGGLARADMIAVYFCSVKKTLAMGVPLAVLIFGARRDLSLILLPIMFYHPLQLFVNGLLANRWAHEAPHDTDR